MNNVKGCMAWIASPAVPTLQTHGTRSQERLVMFLHVGDALLNQWSAEFDAYNLTFVSHQFGKEHAEVA